MVESSTTLITRPAVRVTRRDWASAVLVVLLTILALAVGLALRGSVEGRTRAYSDPSGVKLQYPDGWQINTQSAGRGVQIRDLAARGFPTTLGFSSVAIDPKAQDADASTLR